MPAAYDVPILLIIFRRPDTTAPVFEEIRKARPSKLFIACDGPRIGNPTDEALIAETKKIVSNVDWPCDVKTLFREENFGCGRNMSGAISWFFEHVEEGVILEDDCLPSPSFFTFCKELLAKYRDNEKIVHISGVNLQDGQKRGDASYYFSAYQHCWGWASWRRAWKLYDYEMKDYPDFVAKNGFRYLSKNPTIIGFWKNALDGIYNKTILSVWSYQWNFAIWKTQSISITPNINLVSNIGFGPEATHTTWVDFLANRDRFDLEGPIVHPNRIKINKDADFYFNVFNKVITPITFAQRKQMVKDFFNPKKNKFVVRFYQFLKPFLVKYFGWKGSTARGNTA